MELVILSLLVLFLYLCIRVMSTFGAWVTGRRFRAYRNLATRYRGRHESRGMSDPPTVSFSHKGSTVRVGLAPTIAGQPGQIPRTRVVARFAVGIPFRLELAPSARPSPPQPPRGTRAVRLGSPTFDLSFHVRANDEEMARDFLSNPVRDAINRLQDLVHAGGILVSINPERMLVQVDRNLAQTGDALSYAVCEALIILDGLLDGVRRRMTQGIAIVDADQAGAWDEDIGPPICKVCGEPIDEEVRIVCASCNTPHHRDCWEYVGACSIYGCNGKVGVTE